MSEPAVKIGMAPAHPGAFLRDEILDELHLSVSAAAGLLGVRRATLSDLVNGKAALSPEMALRIEKAFGMNMDTLLRMQAWHDAHAMRQRAGEIAVKPYRLMEIEPAAEGQAPPAPAPRPQRHTDAQWIEEILKALAPRPLPAAEIRKALQQNKRVKMTRTSFLDALGQLADRKEIVSDDGKTWRYVGIDKRAQ